MADTKKQIINLLQILEETDEDHPLTAAQLVTIMNGPNYGNSVYRERIYPLIRCLKEEGFDIQCNNKKGNTGYFLNKEKFEAWQIKLIVDSVSQSKLISEEETACLKRKLLKLTSKRGKDKILSIMSPIPFELIDSVDIGSTIDIIMEACMQQKKILFQYVKYDSNMQNVLWRNGKIYELSVFSLYYSENTYYVIGGHDNHRPELTSYRIDRMINVHLSNNPLVKAREFVKHDNPEYVIQEYISYNVDHFSGKQVNLVVEFDPNNEVCTGILHDFVGKNFRLTRLANGKARVSFWKNESPTLVGWFLKNSELFQIIEPIDLREQIQERIKSIAKIYNCSEK